MNTCPSSPWNIVGRILVMLEPKLEGADVDTDREYQMACAVVADRVDDVDVWSALQRCALTCHHCRPIDA